jgi:hypothetical protein
MVHVKYQRTIEALTITGNWKGQSEKYNLIRDNLKLRRITPPFVNLGGIPSPFFYFLCR